MKRKDWLCKTCGAIMFRNTKYLHCMRKIQCGRLIPAWGIKDLPLAIRADYKRFTIYGEEGFWEYVPHAHKTAMIVAPAPGVIVARARFQWGEERGSFWYVTRSFRQAKPPRKNRYHE